MFFCSSSASLSTSLAGAAFANVLPRSAVLHSRYSSPSVCISVFQHCAAVDCIRVCCIVDGLCRCYVASVYLFLHLHTKESDSE